MNLPMVSSVEKYRAETEEDAYTFIEEQKQLADSGEFELKKSACEKKQKKQKGEIVEEYFFVTLTKNYE